MKEIEKLAEKRLKEEIKKPTWFASGIRQKFVFGFIEGYKAANQQREKENDGDITIKGEENNNYKYWFKTNLLGLIGGELDVAKKQNREPNFDFLDKWIDKNFVASQALSNSSNADDQIKSEFVYVPVNSLHTLYEQAWNDGVESTSVYDKATVYIPEKRISELIKSNNHSK